MRRVTFRPPLSGEDPQKFLMRSLEQISEASNEDAMTIADAYRVSNFTATRTLNVATATLTDLANFIATFIDDLQRRGDKRTT